MCPLLARRGNRSTLSLDHHSQVCVYSGDVGPWRTLGPGVTGDGGGFFGRWTAPSKTAVEHGPPPLLSGSCIYTSLGIRQLYLSLSKIVSDAASDRELRTSV